MRSERRLRHDEEIGIIIDDEDPAPPLDHQGILISLLVVMLGELTALCLGHAPRSRLG